ncbi:MAG: DUF488 domain-containing protein [Desulfomonile tiedjei]|nr:DUF488 domain-containing protein [Desulfomonile tiedjei]
MGIRVKRVYDTPEDQDGYRVLVDRLWPRGIKKENARIDEWVKEISPSNELRKWYGHDPEKWEEFKRRYFMELRDHLETVEHLGKRASEATVTFLFSSKELRINNAVALKEYVETKFKP